MTYDPTGATQNDRKYTEKLRWSVIMSNVGRSSLAAGDAAGIALTMQGIWLCKKKEHNSAGRS